MRISATALLCLSVLALSAPAQAQACGPLVYLDKLRVEAGECWLDEGGKRCRGGVPLKLEVNVSPAAPSCPLSLTWNFGDGTPPMTTSEPRVLHSFPAGVFQVVVSDTAQPGVYATFFVRTEWGRFSLRVDTPTLSEAAGPARITVSRDESAHQGIVEYSYGGLPEYIEFTTGKLVFEVGQVSKQVAIPIINDDVFRGFDTYPYFELHSAVGYGYFDQHASFRILDDDAPVHHKFAQRGMRVSEDSGSAKIDIVRTGDLSGATRAIVRFFQFHQVEFAPGESRKTLEVPIHDNDHYSGDLQFSLECWGELTPTDIDRIDFVLAEDERIPSFSPRVIEVHESDTAQVIPIEVSVSPKLGGSTFTVTAERGTAGADDFSYTTENVYWGPSNETVTLHVTINGDDLAESDETFDLEMQGFLQHTVTVRIVDDDRPPFGFAFDAPNYQGSEEEAAVRIVRTGTTTEAASVTLNFRPHTPVIWPDSIEIDFAPGETSKTVPLGADDGFYTGERHATIELDWGGFTGASAELIVTDDEEMPSLSIADTSVIEGAGGTTATAEVELTLSAPVGTTLPVGIVTGHGTAGANDYTPANTRAAFTPGTLSVRVPIAIRGDDEAEPDETFAVNVVSCCEGLAKLERSSATVVIRNDDGGDSTAYRIETPPAFFESQEWLIAYVTRTDATSAASVTVKLTADAARQFPPATIRFQPGQVRREVRFFLDDPYFSGDAAATLEVFSGDRRDDKRDITILEEEPRPTVVIRDATVIGNAWQWVPAVFTLTVEPPSWHPLELHVTAVATRDIHAYEFEPVDRDLIIPGLTTRLELPVDVRLTDPDRYDRRVFGLELIVLPGTAATLARNSATGTVTRDNAVAGASLADYDPLVPVGTARRITIVLPVMAVNAEPVLVESSAPQVLAVPANVTTTPGSKEISFDAAALSDGDARLTITLPLDFEEQTLEAALFAYTTRTPVATPSRLVLRPGELARIKLSSTPSPFDAFEAAIEARDGSIVFTDRDVPVRPGGPTEFEVFGAKVGKTELVITFPAESGHTTLVVPVEVVDTTPRRRSAGR